MTSAASFSRPDTSAGRLPLCVSGGIGRPDAASRRVVGTRGRCPTARALAAGVPPRPAPAAPPPVPAPQLPDADSYGRGGAVRARCADRTADDYDRPFRTGPTHLDDPGDLLAAIPAMLGFRPERSLVLAVLCASPTAESAVIDLVVRFDLRHPDTGSPAAIDTLAAAATRVCARPGVVGVLVVLVDDERYDDEQALRQRVPVLGELEKQLSARSVPIRGGWAARSISAGQPWWSVTGLPRRGRISDPVASTVTLGRVLEGRPIRRSRSELTGLVAADGALREQVSNELAGARDRAKDRYVAAARRGDPAGYLRGELSTVLWLIANAESDGGLGSRELAQIAVALRDREIRDAVFAVADTAHAEATETLLAKLTRALDGADRAEAATLLGFFAYVRGDGPFAGIALDIALDSDPHHSMAALLHTALEAGMRPERLRDLAQCGREAAAALGVDLTGAW
ncbi:DUF4192 domain-containing protein [Nocardia sp. NBC_01329]|uniref:DUF4192 domain-containing protein n=1 Tax=Nocardia sp. NBC_01329 TaxID=2903594 RepID=UPI002E0ECBA0|nr:DUF4192 domain-containing protein [Nocardia sp. NBC_01329]